MKKNKDAKPKVRPLSTYDMTVIVGGDLRRQVIDSAGRGIIKSDRRLKKSIRQVGGPS